MKNIYLPSQKGKHCLAKLKSCMRTDFLKHNKDAQEILGIVRGIESGCKEPYAKILQIFDHIHRIAASSQIDEHAILHARSLGNLQEVARGSLEIKELAKEVTKACLDKRYLEYFQIKQ